MKLQLKSLLERASASLFLVPMLAVVGAVGLAWLTIGIDSRFHPAGTDLPLGLTSTVESARTLLSTIAGATITFAGIAFSVSLLTIQQASNQYSPRVVHTLFRDPFNKRIMALVVGTFTYCLLVLRSVRTALDEGGDPVIPNLSVGVALVLGIATILGIVAFIDHSAHSMDISTILRDVQHHAVAVIRREWSVADQGGERAPERQRPPHGPHVVTFDRSGWIEAVDVEHLAACLLPGQTMWVDAQPGRFAVERGPLCSLSFVPDDADEVERHIRDAVAIGRSRTMQQDVSFGLRQLADVGLRALSPSTNDPTTARDAIFHLSAVLSEVLMRAPRRADDGPTAVVLLHEPTHAELIQLAFDELRQAAAGHPTVSATPLDSLALLADLAPTCRPELERQAALVLGGSAAADLLPADLQLVQRSYATLFGST